MNAPRSLLEKIWERHAVVTRPDGAVLLHVGRHLLHDGSRAGFRFLAERGLPLRSPDHTFGTPDHYVSTASHALEAIEEPFRRAMVTELAENAATYGFTHFGLGDPRQGIIHVIGPEQGISLPGIVMVCGDSHTASHGALGALAFGIGASEVAHVLATQTVWQSRKPGSMRINVEGRLNQGVFAKDVILAIVARIGAAGGTGKVLEYAGQVFRDMSIEGRLTVCNMSIEAGARAGMVAPDETTFAYLKDRPFAPKGALWDQAVAFWRTLPSDPGAAFDEEVTLDGGSIAPMATWGTSPEHAAAVTEAIPDPASAPTAERREAFARALNYMGLQPGQRLDEIPIDRVFIGSCTNSRFEDLREAAAVVKGRSARVPAWVVPGSGLVKRQAEAEGLDRIFKAAGFEWREPGCSMCVGMNGDLVEPGAHCASTSNRNFVGRQGQGARTHLMSPAMAAAAALTGHVTDVRRLMAGGA
ncbi:MAG TPA: 3-isopropylmalate dehydratase large subunit [Acetobacteraceae bacterium]|nr:3-isopropylmalate dehydratase large subunit [Acetobacteraceae bacterium]